MKKNTVFFGLAMILLFLVGCSTTNSPGTGQSDCDCAITYTVVRGDNLWEIVQKEQGLQPSAKTVNDLIKMNLVLFPGGLNDKRISYGPARYYTKTGIRVDSSRTWRYALILPGETLIIGQSNNPFIKALAFFGRIGNNFLNILGSASISFIPSWLIGSTLILMIATLLALLVYRLLRRRRRGRAPQQEQQEGGDDTAHETTLATT